MSGVSLGSGVSATDVSSSSITTALGYTPVNKAGDTITGNLAVAGAFADTSYSYQTPATGFTITIANNITTLLLEPAAGLASGTITMPAIPMDGQEIRITSTQNIVTLTVSPNSGQTIKNAPTGFTVSLTGDQGYEFIYRLANTTWYRLQ